MELTLAALYSPTTHVWISASMTYAHHSRNPGAGRIASISCTSRVEHRRERMVDRPQEPRGCRQARGHPPARRSRAGPVGLRGRASAAEEARPSAKVVDRIIRHGRGYLEEIPASARTAWLPRYPGRDLQSRLRRDVEAARGPDLDGRVAPAIVPPSGTQDAE